jgi:hypothetical protein
VLILLGLVALVLGGLLLLSGMGAPVGLPLLFVGAALIAGDLFFRRRTPGER